MTVSIKGRRLLTILVLGAAASLLTPDTAEAKRGNGNGNRFKSVSCCKVLGVYQPRLTHTSSQSERFFLAIQFQSGGR